MAHMFRRLARAAYIKVLLGVGPVWRYGMNLGPTVEHRRQHATLDAEALRVLSDLNRDGVARSTLSELTGSGAALTALGEYAAQLEQHKSDAVREKTERLTDVNALGNGQDDKVFVVTLLDPDRPVVEPDGVLANVALHAQLKGIADAYYSMRTRVTDVNIWRNLASQHEPVASQLWHRDLPGDHLILKMFIYLEGVDDGAGPFSYIKGTHGKGRRRWKPNARYDGYNWRATDADVRAVTGEDERPTFTGPAGTVLFADTFGWHKGGQSITAPRLVLQALYASKAALPDRMLGLPKGVDVRSAPRDLKFDRVTSSV